MIRTITANIAKVPIPINFALHSGGAIRMSSAPFLSI